MGSTLDGFGRHVALLSRSRRSRRRRTIKPLHSHRVEEPAKAGDLSPAGLPPSFNRVVVLLACDARGQNIIRGNRLSLDPQVCRRREGYALRLATGDSDAETRDHQGRHQGGLARHGLFPFAGLGL